MTHPEQPPSIPRGAIAADVLAAALVLLGVGVLVFGPTPRFHVLGLRLSVSAPDRAYLLAALILAVRHWFVPRHPVLAPLARWWIGGRETGERRLFSSPGAWWRRAGALAALTIAFCLLVAAATWPQIRRLDSVPDIGDPLFSVWRIAWIAHQVVHDPLHLFNGNMFYPEHLTLTYSDSVVVPGLMAAPFLWLGGHQLVVYNLLFLSGFALSGVTMFLLVRALTGRRDAAAIAGVVFALYPFRFEHYSHLEMQMTMWMPLVLWGVHRTMALGRLRDGLATGAAMALQTLSSLYFGVFMAVYLVPLAGALWIARHRPRPPVRALAAGAVLAAVLVAPVVATYIVNKPVLGERSEGEARFYSAQPADYLRPHLRSMLYHAWSDDGHPERQLFPGFAAVALAIVALWRPIGPARLGYALALLVAFEMSLGFNGTLYPWLYDYALPFRGLRVPARASILVGLTLAVLAGYGAARLFARWPRWRVPLAAALLAAVVVEPLPRLTLESIWHEPPPIYQAIPAGPPAVLAEFPVPPKREEYWFDTRYIYFSTFHWNRLLNGNSGFFPPSYEEFISRTKQFPDAASLDYLRARHVEYFTVHGAFYEPGRFRDIVAALAASPGVELVTAAPWSGSESRLYRLHR